MESNVDSWPPYNIWEYKFTDLFKILKKGTLEVVKFRLGGGDDDVEAIEAAV